MKSIWKNGIAALACAAALLTVNGQAGAASYSFTDLGAISQALFGSNYVLGGMPDNAAYGINDSGTVVGILKGSFSTKSATHVISWNGTTATDVGMQPLSPTLPSNKSYGYGINNSGKIVGYTQYNSAYYAFLYDPTTKTSTELGRPSGSSQATATAINDSGQVVGFSGDQKGPYAINTAFIYNGPGTIKYIPGATVGAVVSGVSSSATAINNTGLVTGYSTISLNTPRAFIYDSATNAFSTLGTLGGATSQGTDINDSGAVVGYSTMADGTTQHAFLYSGGTMIDLGALGAAGNISQANAINNAGTIVGSSNGHAFVYSNGHMVDLNTLNDPASGFTLTTATGINNLGQIVGMGTISVNGTLQTRAFELTPSAVPIPPAVLLFGSGLAGLGLFRRRARV